MHDLPTRRSPSPRKRQRPLDLFSICILLGLSCLLVSSCRDDSTPPDSWEEVELANEPQLFETRQGHPALIELEGLHLGQKSEPARSALRKYCEHPVRRDSRQMGSDAYFLGCRLEDHETIESLRIGFWPDIGERVATLEYKRKAVPPRTVRQRYLTVVDEEGVDETLEPRSVRITSARYRLFADWDEGKDGPTHIVVGFSPHLPASKARPKTE